MQLHKTPRQPLPLNHGDGVVEQGNGGRVVVDVNHAEQNPRTGDAGLVCPAIQLHTGKVIQKGDFFLEILLNQPDIRLYLPFSDWLGTKWTSVWFQIIQKMVYTI